MLMRKRIAAVLLSLSVLCSSVATNELLAAADSPAVEPVYVSEDGTGDGSSIDSPKDFNEAMTAAADGDVFSIVGTVNLPLAWESPEADVTITGQGAGQSVLMMRPGGTGTGDQASILLQGGLTLDNLTLDVKREGKYGNLYVIAANGHPLVFQSGLRTSDDTSTYSGRIYGGGYQEDITGDTHIENHGTLLVTDIYGGGLSADVTGNTYIKHTGYVQAIYGGGGSVYGCDGAYVSENTAIEVIGGGLSGRKQSIYGGGSSSSGGDTNVGGNVTITVDSAALGGKQFDPKIHGAGLASSSGEANVAGNVSITVKNTNMAGNNASVYGGGTGYFSTSRDPKTANVGGNVTILYEKNNYGYVFGGGEENADIAGTTRIAVKDCTGYPSVYAGGEGNQNHAVTSEKDVTVAILNTRLKAYTLGRYAKVNGKVEMILLGGGADRADTNFDSNLYNYDEKNTTDSVADALVRVTGDSTITRIVGFPQILIQDGGVLNEHTKVLTAYGRDEPVKVFTDIGDIRIEKGGKLDLLQDNEITGDFVSSGNLTTVSGEKLIVDGTVSSTKDASYTSSDFEKSYQSKVAFLQAKVDSDLIAAFQSTDGNYFVENRAGTGDVKQEWYLNKDEEPVIQVEDKTLTVGDKFDPMAGVSAQDKENGDLTKEVTILENTVNTAVAGTYQVTYRVEDTYGHVVTKTIHVTVNPKMESLNAIPAITAEDKTLTVGDEFDLMEGVSAEDKEDGDLTKAVTILENTVNPAVAGAYQVTYRVEDSQGAAAVKTIHVTVKAAETKPTEPSPPTEPSTPTEPSAPTEPDDPTQPSQPTEPSGGNPPPVTGENTSLLLTAALLLAVSGGLLLLSGLRRKSTRNIGRK